MNCPNCKQKTIRFDQWKKAANAFNWICPHCHATLKANKIVVITFWLALLSGTAACILALVFLPDDLGGSDLAKKGVAIGATLLAVLPFGLIAWFKGGYVEVAENERPNLG